MGDTDHRDKPLESKQVALEELQRRFEMIRKRIREIERKALAKLASRER